jgi:hypothetical protein
MKNIVYVVAMVVVAFFAGLWLVICMRVMLFTPDSPGERLVLSENVITAAGFLATTVGAGTAAVLGITIKDVGGNGGGGSLAQRVNREVGKSPLLIAGILTYLVVGTLTLTVWLTNPDESPDLIGTFALGILGWAGGAFASVFKAE